MSEFDSPKDGILWRGYDETITLLNEKARPVLAFVLDDDGTRWPFLREIFRAMPKNEKLRNLVNGPCAAMLLNADSMPAYSSMALPASTAHSRRLSSLRVIRPES